ncbi:MAG: hypothetical protein PHH37_15755 [Paludibacter sp.]|nr:hypothetical protein [Paludibacter sp.]
MKKQIQNKKCIIRFRRWSRAGFAVFASLSTVVTIGVLTYNVSEKSLDKTTCKKAAISVNATEIHNGKDKEVPEQTIVQAELTAQIITEQTNDIAAAKSLTYYTNQYRNG